MKSPNHLEDDYRELDLKPGATLEEVKSSYRELALFWHPDQFHDRPSRLPKAHQKMTRINLAYERLRKALAQEPHPQPASGGRNTARPPSSPARPPQSRTNSLGMRFVSVSGTSIFMAIWQTRVRDYRTHAHAAIGLEVAWKNPGFPQTPNEPVVNVSWNDAKNFCVWLTETERQERKLPPGAHYRLPTDAEWSWAVGIGDREDGGTPKEKGERLMDLYPWGTEWPPPKGAGNYHPSLATDSFDHTSPVGSFAPNAQGLFDLGGNVWEWCEDCLEGGGTGARVLRGGSWNFSGPRHLLSSYRNGAETGDRSSGIGFRCVLANAPMP